MGIDYTDLLDVGVKKKEEEEAPEVKQLPPKGIDYSDLLQTEPEFKAEPEVKAPDHKAFFGIDRFGKPSNGGKISLSSSMGKKLPYFTIGKHSKQTGLEGMKDATMSEITGLSQEYNMPVNITGGTEKGHREGKHSHEAGHKVDISLSEGLDPIIQSWEHYGSRLSKDGKTEKGYQHPKTGSIYWKEGDHWDIEVDTDQTKFFSPEDVAAEEKAVEKLAGFDSPYEKYKDLLDPSVNFEETPVEMPGISLGVRPDIEGGKTVKRYLDYGQEAMKLFAIRPDVALGLNQDISQEELEMTQDRWADVIKGTYPELEDPESKLAQSTSAQFMAEMAGDLLEMGTKPSTFVAWGVAERVIPKIALAAFKKLPKGVQSALLKERFLFGRTPMDLAYKELGLKVGATEAEVEAARRAAALKWHPDFAPAGQSVKYTRKFIRTEAAYERILKGTAITREAAKAKPTIPIKDEPGIVPKVEPKIPQAEVKPPVGDLTPETVRAYGKDVRDVQRQARKLKVEPEPISEEKVVYHATTKENAEKIKKEGFKEGVLTDTKSDAEDHAQALKNRGNKDVEVVELKIPIKNLKSKGVVERVSGKRVGERFNVVKPEPKPEIALEEGKSLITLGDTSLSQKDVEDAVSKYAAQSAGFMSKLGKTVGFSKLMRKQIGKPLWEDMSKDEQLAEVRERIIEDFKIAKEEIKDRNVVDYVLDRALDPLDPMAGVYKILLKKAGATITDKGGIKLPPELQAQIGKKKELIKTYVGDYISFKTEGGRDAAGDVEKISEELISVTPVGSKNAITIKPSQVTGIKEKGLKHKRETEAKVEPEIEVKPKSETVKEVPAPKGKKISILPRKKQLLEQIDNAIGRAPDTAGERAKDQPDKVTFEIDGGAVIFNNKTALKTFRDKIAKTAPDMKMDPAAPKAAKPRPSAAKKELVGKEIKSPAGYFTDSMVIIKGKNLPKSKGMKENIELTKEKLEEVLSIKTAPAELQYYYAKGEGALEGGVGNHPLPEVPDGVSAVVFESGGKYYTFDQNRFNVVRNRFPNATYGIGKEANRSVLIASEGGQPVAALMPMGREALSQPPMAEDARNKGFIGEKPAKSYAPGKGGPAFAEPEGGMQEWAERVKKDIKLQGLEMPELVKLAQDLQTIPIVKKLVKNLGLFRFGRGIALDVKIFKNPEIARLVLAHEIGHLIDWLPTKTVARGNILGHLATLKNYRKTLLPDKPGGPEALSQKDRARLRRQAEKQLKEEFKGGTREIIEEIIKEIPIYKDLGITADDILSVWKGAASSIRESNAKLYDFIARLPAPEKLDIVQQALRGIIDERVRALGGGEKIGVKVTKEYVKKIFTPEEVTPNAIKKRYYKLIAEEAKKLRLLKQEDIMAELKRVTQWWNPFDDQKYPSHAAYRYSPVELYADALSVMLNQPQKLEEIAPQFYKAFWNYIDAKPEVKRAMLELQNILNMGDAEKLRVRQEDIRDMFTTGEEKFLEERTKLREGDKNLWFKLRNELIDKNTALLDKVKEAQKRGELINPEDNPKYYMEDYNYMGGKIRNLMDNINQDVLVEPQDNGITSEDIGEYLFLQRVVTERADIANPLGHDRDTAQVQLDYLKQNMGPEKFDMLGKAVERFRQIGKKLLVAAYESGLIKEDTFQTLITNPAYATFQQLDYIDEYITPTILKQIGTLKPIANPFVSTTLKMISTLRAIERNNMRRKVVNFMGEHFPEEIQPAKIRRFGKYKSEIVKKEGFEAIPLRVDGKLKAYYVDPYIAQSTMYQPTSTSNALLSILKFSNSRYFRPLFVGYNLGFQSRNLIRDFMRAYKATPEMSFAGAFKRYWEAIPSAKQRVWGIGDDTLRAMQESGMLSFTYNDFILGRTEHAEKEIEYLLKKYDILKSTPSNPIRKVLDYIGDLGNFIETLPKVAGYNARLKSGLNIKEIAHEVRVYVGSPDFYRKGAGVDWYNNVFLFSNAIKEGMRGDYEAAFKNPRTRSGYWFKTAKVTIMPKLMMFLASLGLFGYRMKEVMDSATEYDKTNYTIVPMGMTEDGKAIYLRIPQDETGRFVGGMFWKMLTFNQADIAGSLVDLGSFTGGQLPSLAPVLDLITAWSQYFVGKNPYDTYKGRQALTFDEQRAGGWYRLKPMLKFTAGKMGLYGLTASGKREDQSFIETFARVTPIVSRFIRVTDYGRKEKMKKGMSVLDKLESKIRIGTRGY